MKVGDYVRTNLRNEIVIRKVIDIIHNTTMNDNRMVFDKPTKFTYYVEDNKDYESSQNIIDLIEVGDYVNGHKVNYINKDREHFNISFGDENFNLKSKFNSDIYWLSKEDIKSIVTKEQFESMEYKIGE